MTVAFEACVFETLRQRCYRELSFGCFAFNMAVSSLVKAVSVVKDEPKVGVELVVGNVLAVHQQRCGFCGQEKE